VATRTVGRRRSSGRAIPYRIVIMSLDFVTVYLSTGTLGIALGFMVASNTYTTIVYLLRERMWAHIRWGIDEG
jgi:uncharacterized membrane protein